MSDAPVKSLPLVFDEPRKAKKPPRHLADLSPAERQQAVTDAGLPGYRAKQVSHHYFSRLLTLRRHRPLRQPLHGRPETIGATVDQVICGYLCEKGLQRHPPPSHFPCREARIFGVQDGLQVRGEGQHDGLWLGHRVCRRMHARETYAR